MGVLNQASFLSNKLGALTSLSMNEGLVKQIAESSTSNEKAKLIHSSLKNYIKLSFLFMTITILILSFFSEDITLYIFGNSIFSYAFTACILSMPILMLNSIPYSVLRAFQNVKMIANLRIISSIATLLISVVLIYFFWSKRCNIFHSFYHMHLI